MKISADDLKIADSGSESENDLPPRRRKAAEDDDDWNGGGSGESSDFGGKKKKKKASGVNFKKNIFFNIKVGLS